MLIIYWYRLDIDLNINIDIKIDDIYTDLEIDDVDINVKQYFIFVKHLFFESVSEVFTVNGI